MHDTIQSIIRVTTGQEAQKMLTAADRRAIANNCVRETQGISEYSTNDEGIDASIERGWAMMATLKLLVIDESFLQYERQDVYHLVECIARNAEAWRADMAEYIERDGPWPPQRAAAGNIQGNAGGASKTDMVATG